jgi:hypothetical protein
MLANRGRKGVLGLAVALMLVGTAALMPLATSKTSPGTHVGYTDLYAVDSATLPGNYQVVAGPDGTQNDWQVVGGTLQAINVAGTSIELADPNLPIDLVGNRLVGLCILPEQTINSFFYSGFSINVANLVDINLGKGATSLKIRLNIPSQVAQVLDQAGNILNQVPLPAPVPFSVFSCINIKVDELLNQLLLTVGQALDDLGHVIDGQSVAIPLGGVQVPSGTVGFTQPAENTARVEFKTLYVQATPDVPVGLKTYAGPNLNQVSLQWQEPAADGGSYVTGYDIYRGTSPDNLQLIDSVPGFTTTYIDTPYNGLAPTTQKYYYAVTAINDVGMGPSTDAACAIPYPVGALPLDGTGLGCGAHGLVSSPVVDKLLGH